MAEILPFKKFVFLLVCKNCGNDHFQITLNSKNAFDLNQIICDECGNPFNYYDLLFDIEEKPLLFTTA